ncbi:MAG: hypothetical protein REI94_09035 [Moraxellaceae bacterium]|nr:hypothetical protein [Moraxellaceae bacterium]
MKKLSFHLLPTLVVVALGLPATAIAVPLYQYTYTSGALDEPVGPDAPISEYSGQRFTISFSTWSPLGVGGLDVTDVRANASIGDLSFGFPMPPPAMTCVPDPWGPPEAPCIDMPALPYHSTSFSLTVEALDAGGLPSAWLMSFNHIYRYDPRSFDYTYDNFMSNNVDYLHEHFVYGHPLSAGPLAWNISEPGAWSLAISEVPAPPTLLLATGALLGLGYAARRRPHARRPA